MSSAKIFSTNVTYITEMEELFDTEQANYFNPEEMLFPQFVYAHEGLNQADFVEKMSNQGEFNKAKSNDRRHLQGTGPTPRGAFDAMDD